jgi:hypothetical protein
MIVLGLRFKRRDAPHLRSLASRVRSGDMSGHGAAIFDQAALAAESGQPLELHCADPVEAVQMAVAYIKFGVTRPVIEELSGR